MPRGMRIGVVLTLLGFHFWTREAANRVIPLAQRGEGMYSFVYRVSLSLVAGRGFHQIEFPNTPEAAPLRDFTRFARPELSSADLAVYFRQPYSGPVEFDSRRRTATPQPPPADAQFIDDHYKTRVLDLRLAALLWSWLGIRWSVYFSFYILVSTLAALCVFLIGREAGGYWTGIAALLLYTASPLENEDTIRSVRDISPLWFAVFGFAFASCLAGKPRARWRCWLSYGGAGAVAGVGYGWRPDALLLPPFLLAFLIVRLLLRGRTREVPIAAGFFVLGTMACLGGIRLLTPGEAVSPQHGFHMAYYGHAARANLLGIEDSHNIFRCDINTRLDASYYAAANRLPGAGEPYLSPAYGATCRAMFLRAIGADSWHLVSQLPPFLFRAIRGTAVADLPINTDYFAPPPRWTGACYVARRFVLDPLYRLSPYLTLIGLVAVLFLRFSTDTAALAVLFSYYGVVLFCVLPEYKHTGLLVLPVSVLSASAVTGIANGSWRKANWKAGIIVIAMLAGAWACLGAVAYRYSIASRAAMIGSIRRVAAGAREEPAIAGPQLFIIHRGPRDLPDRVGYLLTIETGAHPGRLICRRLRRIGDVRYYETLHKLLPNRKQHFFLTSYLGAIEDARELSTTVVLDGDARIVKALKSDLSNWTDLEVSTIFQDGDRSPGSPAVDGFSNRTLYAPGPVDEDLLTFDERLRVDKSRVRHLVSVRGPGGILGLRLADRDSVISISPDLLALSAGARKVVTRDSLRFTTPPDGGQAYLQSPGLTSDRDQRIYLRIRYRLREGNLTLVAFPTDGGPQLAICPQAEAVEKDGEWTETVMFRRRAGEQFFFIIANGYPPLDQPTAADISEIHVYAED